MIEFLLMKRISFRIKESNKMASPYTILSWNVDGYTYETHTWLLSLAQINRPDVIFLSETKKKPEDLLPVFSAFTDYNAIINSHNPSKWHGVAMLIRKDHFYERIDVNMNIPVRKDSYDQEAATGRVIVIHLNKHIYIIGTYTPNSGRSDQIKLDYRTRIWDPTFAFLLETFRNHGHTLWIGDINVALNELDVSKPTAMSKYAGFTPAERANLVSLLGTGNWIDIWRSQNPTQRIYTWLGYPHRPNYGMRLDNIIVSKSLVHYMLNSFMLPQSPESSDHIPIGVYVSRPEPLVHI